MWSFIPVKPGSNKGLLIHKESHNFLSVVNDEIKLVWLFNSEGDEIFKFDSSRSEWVHITSGYRLSHVIDCDPISNGYNRDIIYTSDVELALAKNGIHWSNINDSKNKEPILGDNVKYPNTCIIN